MLPFLVAIATLRPATSCRPPTVAAHVGKQRRYPCAHSSRSFGWGSSRRPRAAGRRAEARLQDRTVSRAIFLYDGDCALCSSCARFIERRIPTGARVEPWQFVDIESLGLTPAQCEDAVQWVAAGAAGRRDTSAGAEATAALAGAEAIAALLRSSSRPVWRGLGRLLGSRAGLLVAWPVYRWVSRHRHRLPGGTPACAVPDRTRASTVTLSNGADTVTSSNESPKPGH
jgi:predicted DCC family thiol-disulfide oxidoreductase YuxK